MAESLLKAQVHAAKLEVKALRRALERLPGPVRGDTGAGGELRQIEAVTADLERAGALR